MGQRPNFGACLGRTFREERTSAFVKRPDDPTTQAMTRYRALSAHLMARFGERVQRVVLAGGFTCPNRDGTKGRGGCTFCSAIAMKAPHVESEDLRRQLAEGMERMERRYGAKRFLAYLNDFSATYAPVPRLRRLYEAALSDSRVVGLALGTRPDCLPEDVLDLLTEVNEKTYLWVELGLQSASDATLQRINRGHDVSEFQVATKRLAARGIAVCAHVILGLPGEGLTEFRATASLVSNLPLAGVKLHNLHVLRGSAMEREHELGGIPVFDKDQYVDAAIDFLEHIPASLVVHRLVADAPRRLVVAPQWMQDKNAALSAIRQRLVTEDRWQGRALGDPRNAPHEILEALDVPQVSQHRQD